MLTFQTSNDSEGNILDLIITTSESGVSSLQSNPILGELNKGHLVLSFKFHLRDSIELTDYTKHKFIYRRGDYNLMSNILMNVDWPKCFEGKSIQEMYDIFIFYLSN
jgi:hypothetical protein